MYTATLDSLQTVGGECVSLDYVELSLFAALRRSSPLPWVLVLILGSDRLFMLVLA